ncbi:MAG: phosphoribosyltransferase family protein, partial [Pseudomonadota bacterium]
HNIQVPFAFNRKEAKDHGEGGQIIGADLNGKVMIIDDVITAGTAINQAAKLIRSQGADIAAIIIAFDRQERNNQNATAVDALEKVYNLRIESIFNFADLVKFLSNQQANQKSYIDILDKLNAYHQRYGI